MSETLPPLSELVSAQAQWTADWHDQAPTAPAEGLRGLVQANHWQNFSLWHEEDQARRDDLGAEHVYRAKRAIDRHNQLRNNAMEQIDAAFLALLGTNEAAPLNSETPGMMLDRLSILALKAYHMEEEVNRPDATAEHREKCAARLAVIRAQRSDLAGVLERFLGEVARGERRFKVYFQFKMYNDPSLNPQLYGRAGGQPS